MDNNYNFHCHHYHLLIIKNVISSYLETTPAFTPCALKDAQAEFGKKSDLVELGIDNSRAEFEKVELGRNNRKAEFKKSIIC